MISVSAIYAWLNDDSIDRIKLSRVAQTRIIEMLRETLSTLMEYRPEDYSDYKLDDSEIYRISGFRHLPTNIENAKISINAETLNMRGINVEDIKAIVIPFCSVDGIIQYAFQASRKETKTLRNGIKLFIDSDTFEIEERKNITITNDVDCIFKDSTLFFCSSYYVKQLFPLTEYYRIATVTEVNNFTRITALAFDDQDAFIEMSDDTIIRRKIALLNDTDFFRKFTFSDVQDKANSVLGEADFCRNGKITFPNDKRKVKQILKFFCDELYHGTFDESIFETNSKKKVTLS